MLPVAQDDAAFRLMDVRTGAAMSRHPIVLPPKPDTLWPPHIDFLRSSMPGDSWLRPPSTERVLGLHGVDALEQQLVVHREVTDLRFQTPDLLIPMILGPLLQRRLTRGQASFSPPRELVRSDTQLAR